MSSYLLLINSDDSGIQILGDDEIVHVNKDDHNKDDETNDDPDIDDSGIHTDAVQVLGLTF